MEIAYKVILPYSVIFISSYLLLMCYQNIIVFTV